MFSLLFGLIGFFIGDLTNWLAERYVLSYHKKKLKKPPLQGIFSPFGILIGILCAITFSGIYLQWGLQLASFQFIFFCCDLLFLARVDYLVRIIPNGCIIFAFVIRIIFFTLRIPFSQGGTEAFYESLLGCILLGSLMALLGYLLTKASGQLSIGGGDIKLFAVVGFYFGFDLGIVVVLVSCLFALFGNMVFKKGKSYTFPFGPAIALACISVLLI